jgi:hypothetical protein
VPIVLYSASPDLKEPLGPVQACIEIALTFIGIVVFEQFSHVDMLNLIIGNCSEYLCGRTVDVQYHNTLFG